MTIVDTPCSRRAVLQGLAALGASALVLDACTNSGSSLSTAATSMCGPNMCLDLTAGANAPLGSVGGALLVDTARDTIMVIRTGDTTVVALSAICTHAGCSMDYDGGGHRLTCPCHGSTFGEDGHVISGPARRALTVYQTNLANNVVTIVL